MSTNTNELLSEDILGKAVESQVVVPDLEKPAFSGAGVETIPVFHLSQYVFTQIKKFGGRFPQLPPDALHYLKQEEYFEDAPTEAKTWSARSFVPWSVSVAQLLEGPSISIPRSELVFDRFRFQPVRG